MGRTYPGIDSRNADFIRAQHVFFVATALAGPEGHLNLSPKGLESFVILNGNAVAYLDLVGSGVETVARLLDWADRQGADGIVAYQLENNHESIDGLPGLKGPKAADG
jgi:hypothetical protein